MSLPRRLNCLATVALLTLLVTAPPAGAASIVAWDIAAMTDRSDYVVEATVKELINEPLMDGGVQTRNVLEVTSYLKGSGPKMLDVVQPGGALPDGRVLVLSGDIRLRPGARVVLFAQGTAPEVHATLLGWSAFEVAGTGADAAVERSVRGLSLFTQTDDGQLAPTGADELETPRTLAELRSQVAAEVNR